MALALETGHLRIACSNPDALRDRLQISYVCPADDDRYTPGAYSQSVPRRLSPDERDAIAGLLATPDTPTGATLELVDDPRFRDIASTLPDLGGSSTTELWLPHWRAVLAETAFRGIMPATSELIAIVKSEANRRNTSRISTEGGHFITQAYDFVGRRPGLHIDNKFRHPLERRIDSPRRLGLNLGPGSRWLLMVLPDIITMTQDVLEPHEIPTSKHFIAHTEMSDARSIKCLWLLQKPYEAYIAPTEIMVHDATTIGEPLSSTMIFWTWHKPVGALALSVLD